MLLFVFFVFCISQNPCLCQILSNEQELNELLEQLYEDTGKEIKLENLQYFLENPKPLDKYTSKELSSILNVSAKSAKQIISLFKKTKSLQSICDSLNLTPAQCNILNLVTKEETTTTKSALTKRKSELTINFFTRNYHRSNKVDTNFVGSPIDTYNKLLIASPIGTIGVAGSKDIGEKSPFDTYKYFAQYRNENFSVILGNFTANNNLGLILSNPFGTYKSVFNSEQYAVLNSFYTPNLSSYEYGVFNGIATQFNFNFAKNINLEFGGFFSNTFRAGTFDTIRKEITSVYTNDLFRTSSEINKKNQLKEKAYLGYFSIELSWIQLNYTLLKIEYDKFVSTSSKKFFNGQNQIYHSLGFSINPNKNFIFSNEFAFAQNSKFSLSSFALLKFEKTISTILVRYCHPEFNSPFGALFGENSYPNNEFGIFFSIQNQSKIAKIFAFVDYFKTISTTYYLQVPKKGNEIYIQIATKPFEKLNTKILLRSKEKTEYTYNIQGTKQIPFQQRKTTISLENTYQLFKKTFLKSRTDFVYLDFNKDFESEQGWNEIIEFRSNITINLQIGGRINFANTRSFASSIYVFEINSPNYFVSEPFYEQKFKFSIWGLGTFFEKKLKCYLKYALTNFRQKNEHFLLLQVEFNKDFNF